MAPAMSARQFRPQSGREQETHAFPPPVRDGSPQTGRSGNSRGQRPTRRARSARRGRGGRWPGALGPRLAWDQRSAVAGAMAPAMAAAKGPSSVRAGAGNALRFRRPRATVLRRPAGPGIAEASARPGGREAPAGGGAGAGRGLWAPGGPRISVALWQGRWPLPWQRSSSTAPPGGKRKRTAFPPPARSAATRTRATRTDRGQRPTRRAGRARRGRGGRWPGALGPRRAKGQRGAVAGAVAPAIAAGLVVWSLTFRSSARLRRFRQEPCNPHQERPGRPGGWGAGTRWGPWPPASVLHARRRTGATAPARTRGARAGGRVSCCRFRQTMRPETTRPGPSSVSTAQ
jgi:hypothetical protein